MSSPNSTTTRATTIRGFADQLAEIQRATSEARAAAIPALQVIVKAIERFPTSGQVRRLTGILASVYNGFDYQFAPKDLRVLDRELCEACLAVFAYDHFGMEEIHTMGVFSEEDLHRWIKREGIEPFPNRE